MNSPTHTRTPRATLVKWLLDHPDVWAGYSKPVQKSGKDFHALEIFYRMQDDGIFALRSQCNPKTITRLVNDARLAQTLHSDAKALQESIRNMEAIKS